MIGALVVVLLVVVIVAVYVGFCVLIARFCGLSSVAEVVLAPAPAPARERDLDPDGLADTFDWPAYRAERDVPRLPRIDRGRA